MLLATVFRTSSAVYRGTRLGLSATPRAAVAHAVTMSATTRIVAVGDVHGAWGDADVAALQALSPDVVIFVGDIGNEDVKLVRKINECPYPTLIMLGNHDAWTCLTKNRLVGKWGTEDDPAKKVRQQLELNGDRNLAWNCKSLPGKPVSVVGARPFSKGGSDWATVSEFYQQMYGCDSWEVSCSRTVAAAEGAPPEHAAVLVAHNGPAGLGTHAAAVCGADFLAGGGDWGDVDLRSALDTLHRKGRSPKLLLFGHMHDQLCVSGTRQMLTFDGGTVVLNTAVVPRHRRDPRAPAALQSQFTVCDFEGPELRAAEFVWVGLEDPAAGTGAYTVLESQPLLRFGAEGKRELFNTNTAEWQTA